MNINIVKKGLEFLQSNIYQYRRLAIIMVMLCIFSEFLDAQKMDGITVVAPPSPVTTKCMDKVASVGADWICLVPYGYNRRGETFVKFDMAFQWWGERSTGIRECIKMAKDNELSIMLKPQIYVPGSWIGEVAFTTESDWLAFEKEFRAFTLFWATLAEEEGVEMLCLATECKAFVRERSDFWFRLIKEIREVYCGSITYSANWDSYQDIPFWEALDHIGISAYFPLSDDATPTLEDLLALWKPKTKELKKYSERIGRQILFTEYGYLTVDGCAGKTWEIEKEIRQRARNEQAQANAIEALLTTFSSTDFWAGGFLWKWFPEGKGHEGYPEKDYDPQGKKAEAVIRTVYSKI